MTVLTSDQIQQTWKNISDKIFQSTHPADLDITGLITTISNINTWIDNNAASFNNVLPANVKSNWTPSEKAALLYFVALAKYGG